MPLDVLMTGGFVGGFDCWLGYVESQHDNDTTAHNN